MKTSTRQARRAAAAALAVPILLLCAPFLFTASCLHGEDVEHGYRSMMVLAREEFARRGDLPRWNPTQYAGTPFLGNFQANFYYPPNALFLFLPCEEAFEIFVFLHLLLAAGGMYRLTRAFRLRRSACVLAGLAYALSFSIIGRIFAGHLPYLATQCQAPLFLFLLIGALRRPGLTRWVGLGLGWTAVLTAGNPQFIYHLFLLAAGLAGWQLAARRRKGHAWLPSALGASGALLWGTAVASIHFLPCLEVAAWATRRPMESFYGSHSMEPWHALRPGELLSLLMPHLPSSVGMQDRLYGFWHEKSLHIGVLPLLAAAPAFLDAKRRSVLIFCSAAGALALLDGMAHDLPVHAVLSWLPGYSSFRVPARTAWVVTLCLSVLSAVGWNAVSEEPWTQAGRRRWFIGLGVAAAAAALLLAWVSRAALECVAFAGGAAVALALLRIASARRAAVPLAVAFVAVNLVGLGHLRLEIVPRERYVAAPWYAKFIGPERGAHRLLDLTTLDAAATPHGFRLLRGNGYPLLQSTRSLYASVWKEPQTISESLPVGTVMADAAPLRALNVRWIVSRGPRPDPAWTERAREEPFVLYEDPQAGPHGLLLGTRGEVIGRRPDSDTLEFDAHAEEPGTLRVSEAWMPGWKAWSVGRPLRVRQEGGGLLGIEVPAGPSHVTLRYEPDLWRAGQVVSGIALLLGALAVAAQRIRRKGPQAGPGNIR